MKRAIVHYCFLMLLCLTATPIAVAEPQPQPIDVNKGLDDVLSKPLQSALTADRTPATDSPDAGGIKVDLKPPMVLKGTASRSNLRIHAPHEDPDASNQELMVEWDRWRNRLLRAVQLQIQATVNNPDPDEVVRPRFDPATGYMLPRFPLGTEAWFECTVTRDRRITRARIIQSSGIAEYDRAIITGIRALEGTSMLEFPRDSRRLEVNQEAGIRTAPTSEYHYHQFGDVERLRVP